MAHEAHEVSRRKERKGILTELLGGRTRCDMVSGLSLGFLREAVLRFRGLGGRRDLGWWVVGDGGGMVGGVGGG